MTTPDLERAALEKAIATMGSQTALAASINCKTGHVFYWLSKRVPAEHCLAIERETRLVAAEREDPSLIVTCEELRPDLPWDVLREQTRVAHHA